MKRSVGLIVLAVAMGAAFLTWERRVPRAIEGVELSATGLEQKQQASALRSLPDSGNAMLRKESSDSPQVNGIETTPAEEREPVALEVSVGLQAIQAEWRPLEGARVLAFARQDWGREEPQPVQASPPSDQEGATRFGSLPPGRYVLQLDANSLPKGYRPPGAVDTGKWLFEGVSLVTVAWDGEQSQSVTLTAQPKLRLEGRLHCVQGEVPAGTQVLVGPRLGAAMRAMQYLPVDAQGRFATEEVFLLPYSVTVVLPEGLRSACARIAPPPTFVSLEHGSILDLQIPLGGGAFQAHGRVVDTEGRPVEGLPVLAYYHDREVRDFRFSWLHRIDRVRTDEQGRYRFVGLIDYPFQVLVDPEGARRGPMDQRRLMRVPEVIDVPREQLAGEMDLGTLEVQRAQLYEVRGTLAVQGGDLGQRRLQPGDLELTAEWHPKEWATEAPYVAVDRHEGTFVVTCEAPGERLVLTLTAQKGSWEPWSQMFFPVPGQVETGVTLSFPAF